MILFKNKGVLKTEEILSETNVLVSTLKNYGVPKVHIRRIEYIFAEMLTNLTHHTAEPYYNYSEVSVSFHLKTKSITISTQNRCSCNEATELHKKITYLNGLSAEHKKHMYLHRLANATAEKSGAGLGLIGISRKCEELNCVVSKPVNHMCTVQIEAKISANIG